MNNLSLEAAAGVYSGTAHDAKPQHIHIERNKAFKAGAAWQRNHVWHKPCDIAEPGRDCLVEYMDGHGNVCIRIDRRTEYEWVNASHYGNHVWHKPCDIAEPGRDCLVEYMDGHGNVCIRIDRRTEYEWVNASHYDKILRWAYLSDLMPTSFDDILENNKDVLQRLKKGEVK